MLYQKVSEMEQENAKLKERVRYLEELTRENPSDKPYHCRECVHFCQHYARVGGGFHPVYDGHCAAGRRVRKTVAESETCSYFEKARHMRERYL